MHKLFLFIVAVLLLGSISSAQAASSGQLFPPKGQSSGSSCANGQSLTWKAGNLECTNPSPAVSTTPTRCPTGKVLAGVKSGKATCIVPPIPTIKCAAGYAIQEIKGSTTPRCINIKSAAASTLVCGAGKAIQKVSGEAVTCIDVNSGDTTTVTCPTGKAVQKITNGTATCIDIGKGNASLTAACPSGQVLQKIIDGVPYCTLLDTTSGLTLSCSTGQVLTGISNGRAVCRAQTVRIRTTPSAIAPKCNLAARDDPWKGTQNARDAFWVYKMYRWANTCGARYCRSLGKGYVTGKVSEYLSNSANVDCW